MCYPPLLAPRLRMNRAIPLHALSAYMACYGETITITIGDNMQYGIVFSGINIFLRVWDYVTCLE
jgi:hypothetical protein